MVRTCLEYVRFQALLLSNLMERSTLGCFFPLFSRLKITEQGFGGLRKPQAPEPTSKEGLFSALDYYTCLAFMNTKKDLLLNLEAFPLQHSFTKGGSRSCV